ncbi:MAG: hypothetical protein WCS99_09690 [Limisphaerales bacterium]
MSDHLKPPLLRAEMQRMSGDVRDFVPGNVGKALAKKVGGRQLQEKRTGKASAGNPRA